MSNPVAVIQRLEDSPLWLDRGLVSAYLETKYRVFEPEFEIRIGQRNAGLENWLLAQSAETYAFITAWNPASQFLPDQENRKRNRLLKKRLQEICRLVLSGDASGDRGDWPAEPGYFAIDILPETAVQLGLDFGQNAIVFWKTGGLPELWWLKLPL